MAQFEFAQIYADHKERVWRLVSRYAASQQDREDLFQEVFLKVHKALSKFRGEADLGTWIYRITVNTAINFFKKQNRYAAFKDILGQFRSVEGEGGEEIAESSLAKLLSKLNPRQRIVVVLVDIEEKKLDEIAGLLSLPLGTVKSILHRGRELLRKELDRDDKL